MRRGFTLIECVTAVTITMAILALVVPRLAQWTDGLAVGGVVADAAAFYEAARLGAIVRDSRVRIEFRPDSLRAFFEDPADSLFLSRAGPAAEGVLLTASRPTVIILPTGLGSGSATTTLVFRRGQRAESLTTSRLGRLKRWR